VIRKTWADAAEALDQTDRLVVFGYSLPTIDLETEKLLERALRKAAKLEWLDVINPDPNSAARFASIAGARPVHWYASPDHFHRQDSFKASLSAYHDRYTSAR
jgi:hypothetical protein